MKLQLTLIFACFLSISYAQDTIGYRVNPIKIENRGQRQLPQIDVAEVTEKYSIKKQALLAGSRFNTKVLEPVFSQPELNGKSILLIFWEGECNSCTENMSRLNPQLRALIKEKKSVLISVTPNNKEDALNVLRYTPVEHTDMISNAKNLIAKVGIQTYPAFILTDEDHKIKLAVSGNDREVYSLLRHHLRPAATTPTP